MKLAALLVLFSASAVAYFWPTGSASWNWGSALAMLRRQPKTAAEIDVQKAKHRKAIEELDVMAVNLIDSHETELKRLKEVVK